MLRAIRFEAANEQSSSPPAVPAPEPPAWGADLLGSRMTDNVLAELPEALPEQAVPATVVGRPGVDDDEQFIRGIRRFDGSVDRQTAADKVRAAVVADADWWRIEAHDCTHDEPAGGPCDPWDQVDSGGSLPGWL